MSQTFSHSSQKQTQKLFSRNKPAAKKYAQRSYDTDWLTDSEDIDRWLAYDPIDHKTEKHVYTGAIIGGVIGALIGVAIGISFFSGNPLVFTISVVAFAIGGTTAGSLAGGISMEEEVVNDYDEVEAFWGHH